MNHQTFIQKHLKLCLFPEYQANRPSNAFCCKITCFLILPNSRPGPKKTLSSGNSQIGVQMDICYCSSSSYRGTLLALSHTPPSPILRQKYAQTFYHIQEFCNAPTKIYRVIFELSPFIIEIKKC